MDRVQGKRLYYIMAAVEDSDTAMDCTPGCMKGFAYCPEGCEGCCVILVKGVYG